MKWREVVFDVVVLLALTAVAIFLLLPILDWWFPYVVRYWAGVFVK